MTLADSGVQVFLVPTRKLRDDLLHRLERDCSLQHILPLGQSDDSDLLWEHGVRLLELRSPEVVARLEVLEGQLDLEEGRETVVWYQRLAEHHTLVFNLYHQVPTGLFDSARVAVSTYSYWCKHQAREASSGDRLLRDKRISVVYLDEADMNSLGGLMCATWNCAEVILAFDPGQSLWPTGSRENRWLTEADREPEATILFTGPQLQLRETRRFGPMAVEQLQSCLPQSYSGLRASDHAPQTEVMCWYINTDDWTNDTMRAGWALTNYLLRAILPDIHLGALHAEYLGV